MFLKVIYRLQLDENPVILPRSRDWLELLKTNDIEWFPCRNADEICIRAAEANYVEAILEQILAEENLALVLNLVGNETKEETRAIAQSHASHIIKMIRLFANKILILRRILGSTIKSAVQHKLTKKVFISVGVIATIAITVKILRPHLISVRDRFVKKKTKPV